MLTKFTKNINYHQSQPDSPTLTPTELKKLFDQTGIDIKEFINETLTEEVDSTFTDVNGKIIEWETVETW